MTALAWFGTVSYQFIVLAPVAMMVALQSLWFNLPWADGLMLALLMFVWWLMQGQDAPAGSPVERGEAPGLWGLLDALAERMQVPRLEQVVLLPEPTAAAIEHQDHWLPWRQHRTLALGVPLLAGLPADELAAVVAHELGHFSRHFGMSGHWLYRARLGWTRLLDSHRQDMVWYRAAAGFARWFVPLFERLSAAQAVHDEYEADALAARATSGPALGRALARLAAARETPEAVFGQGPLPTNPLSRAAAGLRNAVPMPVLEQALQDQAAWHARQDPAETTHPATADRLQALGLTAAALVLEQALPDDAAGPAWWGAAAWAERLAHENQAWRAEHGRTWATEAAWRSACEARLAQRGNASDDQAAEWRQGLDLPHPRPSQDLPGEAATPLQQYWLGVAWLAHDPAAARPLLEAAIAGCVGLAAPARARLANALADSGAGGIERDTELLAVARRRRDDARLRAEALGLAAGHAIDTETWRRDALCAALAVDDAVLQAHWVQHDVTLSSGRTYEVVTLCLRVDLALRVSEEQMADAYAALLARAITPARVGRVRSWWNTETWPEALQALAATAPQTLLKPPRIAAPTPV